MHAVCLALCLALAAAPPLPAPDFQSAVAATEGDTDILVYLHGSDWCRLGEKLLTTVWEAPEFAVGLGRDFLRVAVDRPEGNLDEPLRARLGPVDATPVSPVELLTPDSAGKALFTRLPDGSYRVRYPDNRVPGKDALRWDVVVGPGKPVTAVVFQALPDAELPNQGPGFAANGNYCVSEFAATLAGAPCRFSAAWADNQAGDMPASMAIDGLAESPNNAWNRSDVNQRSARLVLVPETPLPAGARLSCTLHSKSQWPQHIPGHFRLLLLRDPATAALVTQAHERARTTQRNSRLNCSPAKLPALCLCTGSGTPYAEFNDFSVSSTPEDALAAVKRLHARRRERDRLLAAAETATGLAKANLLGQAIELPELRLDNPLRDRLFKQLKAADPEDKSGWWDHLAFDPGRICKPAYELWNKQDRAGALAALEPILAAQSQRRLTKAQLQRLYLVKFDMLRQWPGHQDERWAVCQQILAIDPDTNEGVGARGYLMVNHRVPDVGLTYGWAPSQVTAPSGSWTITVDLPRYFTHAGKYRLGFHSIGGKDKLTINGVALLADGELLALDRQSLLLTPGRVEGGYLLSLATCLPNARLSLRVDYEATGGDCSGQFAIEPQL